MKDIGEFALACDIKKAVENHFTAVFGSCKIIEFEARRDDPENDDKYII